MGWVIFFISSILIFILTKSFKNLRHLWPAGIIAMVIIYLIDSKLIGLEAFSHSFSNPYIGGLPTLYWFSSFFGGTILVKYYPQNSHWKFPFVLISAFLFLILELIMWVSVYFHYHNSTPINSFILNVFGFIIVIWLWNWIIKVKNKSL